MANNGIVIDPEFAGLIPPMSVDELVQLESNLLDDGKATDPIIVWEGHNIILDGHNRQALCEKHDLPYKIEQKQFADRQAAINWVIDRHLGRRNLAPQKASYLRGRKYHAAKQSPADNLCKNAEKSPKGKSCPSGNTAEKVASECNVSPRTVKNDAKFAEAVDKIAEVAPGAKAEILSGDLKVSKKDVVAVAAKPKAARKAAVNRIKAGKPAAEPHERNGKQKNDPRLFERLRNEVNKLSRSIDDLNGAMPADKFRRSMHAHCDGLLSDLKDWQRAIR
jgi:hypothetical protein